MNFQHTPVLLKEVIDSLTLKKGSTIVDATLGGGGHSSEIIKKISPNGKLIGLDQDITAINSSKKKFEKELKDNGVELVFHNTNFANLSKVLGDEKVDSILADLGVSSHQIDTAERGFSYMMDAPLDMRMGGSKKTAHDVVNNYSEKRLEQIIRNYGEERYAGRIASAIVKNRPISTTHQLAKICTDAVPCHYYKTGGHPAKRTFQGIRIEVNDELGVLERFIPQAIDSLKPKGRLAIITFHSLEDRIVKQMFRHFSTECLCPPKTPQCICGHVASVKLVTKKPIIPSDKEISENPRASSAKLRVVEKI